jgi:hypothetical protein
MNTNDILKKAANGGIAGAGAMSINVMSLMWMRTIVNYQYKNGTSTTDAFKTLYKNGGITRFYRGVFPALLQGPLARFGDTAANTGVNAYWENNDYTKDLPIAIKTFVASCTAASFRVFIMPIDAMKTVKQVEGKDGFKTLTSKIYKNGPSVLWHGSLGASAATFAGFYPWFFTYNTLNAYIPKYDKDNDLSKYLLRNAAIGFTSTVASDTCSNSIRVVKTIRQSSKEPITYSEAVNSVIKTDGVKGLLFRGLNTKILSNGVQGLTFTVMWNLIQDYLN